MKSVHIVVCLCCLAVTNGNSQAGVILQDTGNASLQISFFQPLAQSFTAEDALVVFAFSLRPQNPGDPSDPLLLRLLAGDGPAGSELTTVEFTPPATWNGFYNVDLSAVALTPGQKYTAELSVPGGNPYWGARINEGGNPYPGGRAYYNLQGSNPSLDDMWFRVRPIPEPSTLLGLGLLAGGVCAGREAKLVRCVQ